MDANEENINNNLNDNVNDNAKDNVDATTKKSIRSRARVGLNPNLIVFALIVFAICTLARTRIAPLPRRPCVLLDRVCARFAL